MNIPNFVLRLNHNKFILIFLFYRWCILFGHPSNFFQANPVELHKLVKECEKRNIKLLGITWNKLKNREDWINVIFIDK